jgi:hypothetical protein
MLRTKTFKEKLPALRTMSDYHHSKIVNLKQENFINVKPASIYEPLKDCRFETDGEGEKEDFSRTMMIKNNSRTLKNSF